MVRQTPGGKTAALVVPGWANVLAGGVPGAVGAYNFQTGQYWAQGNPSGGLQVASTTPQYVIFSSGLVAPVGAGSLPVSDLGLAVWEASSNLVTATNDFTNAAWTASSVTAALNATGPDGLANSASTLTATAGNATVTQAITHTSTNEQASIFMRALTVTGAIQLTVDNGATWHAVTPGLAWSQVSIPQQSLPNPTFGIRIVNSGDSVAVWCAQVEPGLLNPVPTAPMPTGYSPRVVPTISLVSGVTLEAIGSVLLNTSKTSFLASAFMLGGTIKFEPVSATQLKAVTGPTGLFATLGSGALNTGAVQTAFGFDATGRSLVVNNGTLVSDTNVTAALGTVYFGSNGLGSGAIDGYIQSAVFWPSRLSNATLQQLT